MASLIPTIPVKEYLGKLGIKQKYHETVLQKQKRFYIIQIQTLRVQSKDFAQTHIPQLDTENSKQDDPNTREKSPTKNRQDQNKEIWESRLTFQIGCRESFTDIQLTNRNIIKGQKLAKNDSSRKSNQLPKQRINKAIEYFYWIKEEKKDERKEQKRKEDKKEEQFRNDMHIFPFEKEQVMSIKFQLVQSAKFTNSKQYSKEYSKQYGYALIPLVPLIKMPYTQHVLDVDLVYQNERKQIRKDLIANLTMSLYFMHNFKARIFIEVVKADLQRNIALIGQMYPMIRVYLRDMEYETDVIEEGGIKPNWKSQKQDEFCYFNIPLESVQDDLFIFLFYNREVTIDEIVGKLRINLQEETMLKKGTNLEKFTQETIQDTLEVITKKIKKLQKQIQGEEEIMEETNIKKREKLGKEKQKVDKMNREERQEYDMKNMLNKLKSQRVLFYYTKLQFSHSQLIRDLICKSHTLNPKKPPQFLNEHMNQIFELYENQYLTQEKDQIDNFIKNMTDSSSDQKASFKAKIEYNQKWVDPKTEIMQILVDEMKEVGKKIGQKMVNREIPLKYINPFPKNQLDTEKLVGILEFRSFFVYEFDHIIKRDQTYAQNDF